MGTRTGAVVDARIVAFEGAKMADTVVAAPFAVVAECGSAGATASVPAEPLVASHAWDSVGMARSQFVLTAGLEVYYLLAPKIVCAVAVVANPSSPARLGGIVIDCTIVAVDAAFPVDDS